MDTAPFVQVKNSIAAQMLKAVFSIYIILTVVVTFTHMSAEFLNTKEKVHHELQVIGSTFSPGLAHALWDINMEQLQPTFLGMVEFPTVVGVKLINERGREIGASGIVRSGDGKTIEIAGHGEKIIRKGYIGLFEYSFPIIYRQREKNNKVGEATIYSSTRVILDKVKLGFFFIIINSIIKTIALWTLFLWISRYMLTRPLAVFTHAAERIGLDDLNDFRLDVKTKGQNELKVLETAFNTMIKRLLSARNRLKTLNQNLERKVKERTRQLEKSNRAKSDFLANMSHELRTPLNGILGYSQILKRKKEMDSAAREGLDIIYRSGTHLLMLINDILDISKIEADKMELYPNEIGMAGFMEGITGIFRLQARQKGIHFSYSPGKKLPSGILTDEKRLRQVLLNLLSNAVKFTDRGGRVTLHVCCYRSQGKTARLHFKVIDTGTGIKADQLNRIFRPFEQVGDISRREEGTGLGLAVSRRIVELMGGRLHVESEFGRGSRFWFDVSFPAVETEAAIAADIRRDIIGYEGLRRCVLVVDDHRDNRTVMLNLLEPLGFDVFLAENGREGVDKSLRIQPDLILMDLVMPVMDGFEAVKKMRKKIELKNTPILAVSASALEPDQEKSRRAGFDDFIPKPVDPDRLFSLFKTHLKIKWQYRKTADETDASAEIENILPPEKDELEMIYELAMLGKMRRIRHMAQAMEQRDPKLIPFSAKIRKLADGFEDEKAVEFVQQYLETDK